MVPFLFLGMKGSSFRLNKNRDPVNDTVVDLLKKSKTCALMVEIYCDHPGQTKEEEDLPPPGHRRGKKRIVVKSKTAAKMANFKTVCSYFRDQLNNLINMLMSTEPSFIRCIVPNNHKKPGDYFKLFSNFHIFSQHQARSTPSWLCTS